MGVCALLPEVCSDLKDNVEKEQNHISQTKSNSLKVNVSEILNRGSVKAELPCFFYLLGLRNYKYAPNTVCAGWERDLELEVLLLFNRSLSAPGGR